MPRLAALGWHCQINMTPKQLEAWQAVLTRLPGQFVFDHLGQVPQPAGLDSPTYRILRRLLDGDRAWMKLSGAHSTGRDRPPDQAESGRVASAYVAAAPERVVWGSDWLHPTKPNDGKPDDSVPLDRLRDRAGSEAQFRRILVNNPASLYGLRP